MRVLYISQMSDIGGASIALKNIINEIHDKVEVAVLLPNKKGWLVDELKSLKCRLYFSEYEMMIWPFSTIKKNGYWNPLAYLKFIKGIYNKYHKQKKASKALENIIRDFKPNIVHCNCGPLDISLNVCIKLGIPHVWHLREYQDQSSGLYFLPSTRKFNNKIHSNGNFNIAITKGIFQNFKLRSNIDKVIYDGVFNTPQNTEFKEYNKENYFLAVGRIEHGKGVLFLLESFALFHKKNPSIQLLIAGGHSDSIYFSECKKTIKKHKLDDSVKFLGIRKDIYTLMQKSKCLIVASPTEGFGFITVEAMLNSCLVLGRDTTGTKEQFDNGLAITKHEIGLRFNTINELAQQMEFAINNDTSEMRKRAYQVVLNEYSIQKHTNQLIEYYKYIFSLYE